MRRGSRASEVGAAPGRRAPRSRPYSASGRYASSPLGQPVGADDGCLLLKAAKARRADAETIAFANRRGVLLVAACCDSLTLTRWSS